MAHNDSTPPSPLERIAAALEKIATLLDAPPPPAPGPPKPLDRMAQRPQVLRYKREGEERTQRASARILAHLRDKQEASFTSIVVAGGEGGPAAKRALALLCEQNLVEKLFRGGYYRALP